MRKNFSITRPISIYPGTNMNGTPNRRLVFVVQPNELSEIPVELFAMKRSQSNNKEKRGKLVFKYLSYKINETTPWSDRAAAKFTDDTPLEEVKEALMKVLSSDESAIAQFTVRMPGKFGKITTADGVYDLFDFDEAEDGNLGYYLKSGTVVTVHFTLAEHQNNEYYRLKLETDLMPDEIFESSGRGKRYTPGQSHGNGAFSSVEKASESDEESALDWYDYQ